jgi:hypothetical protein
MSERYLGVAIGHVRPASANCCLIEEAKVFFLGAAAIDFCQAVFLMKVNNKPCQTTTILCKYAACQTGRFALYDRITTPACRL